MEAIAQNQIQLPQGTTVGLLILQSPIQVLPQDGNRTTTSPDILSALAPNTLNGNINNNNNKMPDNNIPVKTTSTTTASYQKPIRPAVAKSKGGQKTQGNTPPLKPPKKYRDEDNEIQRCKRRLDFAKLGLPFNRPNPISVARRNERERKRVKQINVTFADLRDHLPTTYYENKNPNKMSKVETLRAAIDYINNLQELLDDTDAVNAVLKNSGFSQEALSVQAPQQFQNEPMTSPTGSTCSSVTSQSSLESYSYATNCPNTTETVESRDLPSQLQEDVQLTMADLTALHMGQAPPGCSDTMEADLMDFASWF